MQRSQIIAQARKSEHQKKIQRGQTDSNLPAHHSSDVVDDENDGTDDLSGLDQSVITSGMIGIGQQMPMTPQGGLSGMMQLNNRFAGEEDNTVEPSYFDQVEDSGIVPQSIGQIDESLQNLGQGNMNQSNAFDMPSDFQRGTSMVPDDQNN